MISTGLALLLLAGMFGGTAVFDYRDGLWSQAGMFGCLSSGCVTLSGCAFLGLTL